jgi:superfamily I DNA/RNA helicase
MMSTEAARPMSTMQQRVLRRLDNPFITTPQQATAAKHVGDAFVSACPGAGKTHTVGLRLAYHAAFHPEMSIAAASHTNTAISAIRASARALAVLPEHYFVETLHTFLLRYVVYPFGHLYMGCPDTPRVIGDDDRDWPSDVPDVGAPDDPRLRVKAWRFSIDVDGELSYKRPSTWPTAITEERIVNALVDWASRQKEAYWREGLLSYDDVLWVAFRVLKEHPPLAEAVAARFDELIIDEVQDTGGLQLACLDLLRGRPTRPALVVVGDLCQAVFEWSGATPAGLRTFVAEQGLAELPLTANFRSSQNVCNVTHHFSTRAKPDDARGENASAPEKPELWRYDPRRPAELTTRFIARLAEVDIAQRDAAMLAWTHALVDRLNGRTGGEGPTMHWLLRVLGEAAVDRDDRRGPDRETFMRLDRAVSFIAFGASQPVLDEEQRDGVRAASAELLHTLPTVEGELRAWNLSARQLLTQIAGAVPGAEASNVNRYMTDAAALREVDARAALAPPRATLARTIHNAKGESITAVTVVARDTDAAAWAAESWTSEPPTDTSETLRVAYVAFTRAERLLILAVPEATEERVLAKLHAVGFMAA